MVAATTGASGSPLITCTLPGEYSAAALPDGLKTTRCGAPSESMVRSAGASARQPEQVRLAVGGQHECRIQARRDIGGRHR